MRLDRNAAAVVGHGDEAVGLHLDFDIGRVAGHRLVHGVVDHLGEQVMHRLLVGAADIHARPAAHRLQALQHLDVLRAVFLRRLRLARLAAAARGFQKIGLLALAFFFSARAGALVFLGEDFFFSA